MKIAICDDDVTQIKLLKSYFEKIDLDDSKLYIKSFNNGDSLLNSYINQENPFDIIFIDMEMPGTNGIDTAVKIRNIDDGVIIIFITNYSEYVYECFDAVPFRFLVKPISFETFSSVLKLAFLRSKKEKDFMIISNKGYDIRLNYSDILYFESIKRQISAHTKDHEYLFYSKMNDLYNKIKFHDFIFTHKSFIVNMNHIKILMPDKLTLDNGLNIPLSKKNKTQVRERHLKFVERSFNI